MRIGFVSTWFERGAAYVTKAYIDLLKEDHEIYIYARGGENTGKGDPNWDFPNVTWSPRLYATNINYLHIKKWIKKNNLDIIFFNEQQEIHTVYKIKKEYPNIKLGAYVDYYKDNTVSDFHIYDFLICNTKRHYSVFKNHPQAFYVPWGTDVELFQPLQESKENKDKITFFHSAGMSNRKGTTFVIDSFINAEIENYSNLIIHIQKDFEKTFGYDREYLKKHNIEIIERTVSAPGLYYLGDIYVYPTTLDGLGLTMYEALSCGLPVITTNNAPMNEVINENVGRLVDVEYYKSRSDAYYWPLSIVNEKSLMKSLKYFVENKEILNSYKENARKDALDKWNWRDRKSVVKDIFENSKNLNKNLPINPTKGKKFDEKLKNKIGSSYLYASMKKISKNKLP